MLERALADVSRTCRERDQEILRLSGTANRLEHYVFGLTRILLSKEDVTIDSLNASMSELQRYSDLMDFFLKKPPPPETEPASPLLIEKSGDPSPASDVAREPADDRPAPE